MEIVYTGDMKVCCINSNIVVALFLSFMSILHLILYHNVAGCCPALAL